MHTCCQLQEVLNTLESECSQALCNGEDKEEMLHTIKQAKNSIMTRKSHHWRSVHQDQAKCSVLANIKGKSDVFLVQDWAMKFMPRKFREPQSDWFAKRGLPWHITVTIQYNLLINSPTGVFQNQFTCNDRKKE